MKETELTVEHWGTTRYSEALQRQQATLQQRIDGERGDTLALTQHHPVYTLGTRPGADAHLLFDQARLAQLGIELHKTSRGGDITYHGPGQIVGYAFIDLRPRAKDLHAYLRDLEQALIDALATIGLVAQRREGKTGLWIDTRKIAAIGVAVRQWVTWHGFALNHSPDMNHFTGIIPCGIEASDGTVTSLTAELGEFCPTQDEVERLIAIAFQKRFGQQI